MPIGNLDPMPIGELIVATLPPGLDASFPLGPSVGINTVADATVEIDLTSVPAREAEAMRQAPNTLAIAPVMPVKLIQPVAPATAPVAATTPGSTWGVKAVGADTSPYTGEGVTVAVLDTGIDRNHEAFLGFDIVEKDFTGEGNGDGNGHGTHCAGTILGRVVDRQRIGIAPGVSRLLVGKVLNSAGSGNTFGILQAILWAMEEGADIVSLSLGIDFPGLVDYLVGHGLPVTAATSYALDAFHETATMFNGIGSIVTADGPSAKKPLLLIAAAGNENITNVPPQFEIQVALPASATGFTSVGALGETAEGSMEYAPAWFSNTGVKLAAPGVNVLSAKTGGGLVSYSGTSMATPHVAGVAALWAEKLMLESGGTLNISTLLGRMLGNATTSSLAPGFDTEDVGAGLVQAPQS